MSHFDPSDLENCDQPTDSNYICPPPPSVMNHFLEPLRIEKSQVEYLLTPFKPFFQPPGYLFLQPTYSAPIQPIFLLPTHFIVDTLDLPNIFQSIEELLKKNSNISFDSFPSMSYIEGELFLNPFYTSFRFNIYRSKIQEGFHLVEGQVLTGEGSLFMELFSTLRDHLTRERERGGGGRGGIIEQEQFFFHFPPPLFSPSITHLQPPQEGRTIEKHLFVVERDLFNFSLHIEKGKKEEEEEVVVEEEEEEEEEEEQEGHNNEDEEEEDDDDVIAVRLRLTEIQKGLCHGCGGEGEEGEGERKESMDESQLLDSLHELSSLLSQISPCISPSPSLSSLSTSPSPSPSPSPSLPHSSPHSMTRRRTTMKLLLRERGPSILGDLVKSLDQLVLRMRTSLTWGVPISSALHVGCLHLLSSLRFFLLFLLYRYRGEVGDGGKEGEGRREGEGEGGEEREGGVEEGFPHHRIECECVVGSLQELRLIPLERRYQLITRDSLIQQLELLLLC